MPEPIPLPTWDATIDAECLAVLGGLRPRDPFVTLLSMDGRICGCHPLQSQRPATPLGSRILLPQSVHALSVVLARYMTGKELPTWTDGIFRRPGGRWGFGPLLCWNAPDQAGKGDRVVPGLRDTTDKNHALAEVFTWEARLRRATKSREDAEQLRAELLCATDPEAALRGLEATWGLRPWAVERFTEDRS